MSQSNFKENYYQFIAESQNSFTKNEWYLRVGDLNKPWAFIDDEKCRNGMCPNNHLFFDTSNPQYLKPTKHP